jgi:vancomycin resistance protein YoaR
MNHPIYQMKKKEKLQARKKQAIRIAKVFFWFATGALLAMFLLTSFTYFAFEKIYSNRAYPGIIVDNIDLGKYSEGQIEEFFAKKNEAVADTQVTLSLDSMAATISAKELKLGYDQTLIAKQAVSLGRSSNFLSNVSIIFQAYFNGITLQPSYRYSEDLLNKALFSFIEKINKEPVDAIFTFQNGKVSAFKPSENGREINVDKIKMDLVSKFAKILLEQEPQRVFIPITVTTLLPKITTDKANNLGIKELIGEGKSYFYHSIQSRIFNITLAASKINGALIAPNEIFSFDKALGDVSAFTGYQRAYVIQNGKTVLGDGGGVCQVSTTFFRALLNSGVPITERHAHAYRVGYYEQNGSPGLDATIYVPSVDLKFKNDTGNYILVQTQIDPQEMQLSVFLYGTSDGRTVTLTQPIVSNRTPAPPDLYQDDPTLPKGTVKQVDFSAEGAKVSFSRIVTKNGKKIISENYISNYAPWQSVFLRGTQ